MLLTHICYSITIDETSTGWIQLSYELIYSGDVPTQLDLLRQERNQALKYFLRHGLNWLSFLLNSVAINIIKIMNQPDMVQI